MYLRAPPPDEPDNHRIISPILSRGAVLLPASWPSFVVGRTQVGTLGY